MQGDGETHSNPVQLINAVLRPESRLVSSSLQLKYIQYIGLCEVVRRLVSP